MRFSLAVLLFFAVWEICARVDDSITDGAPLLGLHDSSVLLTTDEFGVTGKPNAHYLKWKMNSLGFRGPQLRWDRERIICIGASETFGVYEPEGLEFPRQLERELNFLAKTERYQVVNGGLPGQSLSSFARRAAATIDRIRPSIAVIYPSLAIYIDPPAEEFVRDQVPPTPKFQARIAGKLLDLLGASLPEFIQTGIQRLQIRWQTRHTNVLDRIPESNVQRFRSDLSRLLDILETERVRPLLVTHATRFGSTVRPEDRPVLTAWRTLHPGLKEDGFLDMENRLNGVIQAEATRRNLMLVDASSQLHGPADFVEFVHFTPGGANKLARTIADEIMCSGQDCSKNLASR